MTDRQRFLLLSLLLIFLQLLFSWKGGQGGQVSQRRPAVLHYRVEAVGAEVREVEEEEVEEVEAAIRNGLMVEN